MARVAWPLVCGVSKKALMKNANGTVDKQNTSSMPRITPKFASLKRPPVEMMAHEKDRMKPKIAPSERK